MNDNLTEMVKEGLDDKKAPLFTEEGLDLPNRSVETPAEAQPEQEQVPVIGTTSLMTWFEKNKQNFGEIKHVKLQVTGVDSKEDLILTIPHESGEVLGDGTQKRRIIKLENANLQPVLDLPGVDMKIYNNGFQVICQYKGNVFVKCYGVKTGLIVTFCNKIAERLIPYVKTKMKKSESGVEVQDMNPNQVLENMSKDLDKEELQILYKQSSKVIDTLESNHDAVNWLLDRQESITDINHHIQVDDVIIRLLR